MVNKETDVSAHRNKSEPCSESFLPVTLRTVFDGKPLKLS
jgi:hypothetical protein